MRRSAPPPRYTPLRPCLPSIISFPTHLSSNRSCGPLTFLLWMSTFHFLDSGSSLFLELSHFTLPNGHHYPSACGGYAVRPYNAVVLLLTLFVIFNPSFSALSFIFLVNFHHAFSCALYSPFSPYRRPCRHRLLYCDFYSVPVFIFSPSIPCLVLFLGNTSP